MGMSFKMNALVEFTTINNKDDKKGFAKNRIMNLPSLSTLVTIQMVSLDGLVFAG